MSARPHTKLLTPSAPDTLAITIYPAGSGRIDARDGRIAWAQSLALRTQGVDAHMRACWRNACLALNTVTLTDAGARYIEGWVVMPDGLLIEHGWVRLRTGEVVDTTATLHHAATWAHATYCEGIAYTMQEVVDLIGTMQPPFVWGRHGFGGFGSLPYRWAHHRASQVSGMPRVWSDAQLAGDDR